MERSVKRRVERATEGCPLELQGQERRTDGLSAPHSGAGGQTGGPPDLCPASDVPAESALPLAPSRERETNVLSVAVAARVLEWRKKRMEV